MEQGALELQCGDPGFSTSGCHEGLESGGDRDSRREVSPLLSFPTPSTFLYAHTPRRLWVHLTRAGPKTVSDGPPSCMAEIGVFPVKRLKDSKQRFLDVWFVLFF